MDLHLLQDVAVILVLSIAVLMVCHQVRVPPIVGFLLTGILAGPHGLRLVEKVEAVNHLAELGVVLLLFTIGIEFSLKKLFQIKKLVLVGGSLQVGLAILATLLIARMFGSGWGEATFMGFLMSLSSTAIVLKILQERAEVESPHGRATLGVLIFQDIIVVPMMLFTPLLAGASQNVGRSLVFLLAKGIGIILLVVVCARWIVPSLLHQIARTRIRELFRLSVVAICLTVAWLTSKADLSLGLGAFLAGLIISESEYSHDALAGILPFRDLFTSIFFVSIGMLLDIQFLYQNPAVALLATGGILAAKAILAAAAVAVLRFPLRAVILSGIALCQIGEFSFVLSRSGLDSGLLREDTYQLFLSVSVLSMAATPFLLMLAPSLAHAMLRLPLPQKLKSGLSAAPEAATRKKDHVVIIGFGVNGRNLSRAASCAGIPYVVLEMNPDTVRREQARGVPITYGDAIHDAVLDHAGVRAARVAVIAISDPVATRRIIQSLRQINPRLHIIARTRFVQEVKPLYEIGADEVIPEEFETSVEIFTRVLAKYLVPRDEIEKLIAEVRAGGYEMFRSPSKVSASISDLKLHLENIEISSFKVAEDAMAAGRSLAQLALRRDHGVTLLAIRRGTEILNNPGSGIELRGGDTLIIMGEADKVAGVAGLFSGRPQAKASRLGDEKEEAK